MTLPSVPGLGCVDGVPGARGSAREWLLELLGLEGAGPLKRVSSIRAAESAIEVDLDTGANTPTVLCVVPRNERSEGLVLAQHLVVYYQGGDLPEPLAERIRRVASKKLERLSFDAIASRLRDDPDVAQGPRMRRAGDPGTDRPASLLETWGGADAWADFFAGADVARAQLDSLDLLSGFVVLQHGDSECMHAAPHAAAPLPGFVNYPWEDRVRTPRASPTSSAPVGITPSGVRSTDLDEDDVIFGSGDKLASALRQACVAAVDQESTLFVATTCVPAVVGEDVNAEVLRSAREAGCPALLLSVTPESMTRVFEEMLVSRRLRAELATSPPNPGGVNLVGFPDRRDVNELAELLSGLDVRVNCRLIPRVRADVVDSLPRAAVNVFYPNDTWQHLYDQISRDTRLTALRMPAPYGLAATSRWLRAVGRSAGRAVPAEPMPGEPTAAALAELLREASGHTLGIAVRSKEVFHLANPASTWGVPLLAILEELGFRLEVLVLAGDVGEGRRAATTITSCLSEPGRHVIRGFRSPQMLLRRLEQSPCEAVFSSHAFDWRLSRAGKNPFSLQHFEMGWDGAVRTTARLLAICANPFFKRFGRHLGGWPELLGPAPGPTE